MGSRLRPLTDQMPKALVPVAGKPLLQWNIEHLIRHGVTEIVVNLHYKSEQIRDFVASRAWEADIVFSDESDLLLDTGGALRKAAPLLRDKAPFFIYNVDILSNIDLGAMLAAHKANRTLATLALRRRNSSNQLLWNQGLWLCGHQRGERLRLAYEPKEQPAVSGAFSGIHAVSPLLLDLIVEFGVFSIIDLYLRLAAQNPQAVGAYWHDQDQWLDVGTPERYRQAQSEWEAI